MEVLWCYCVVVELLVLSVWEYVVSYCVWEPLVSGAVGLWCLWSLVLNGLTRLLVSGVGWSLELCFVRGVVLFGVGVVFVN